MKNLFGAPATQPVVPVVLEVPDEESYHLDEKPQPNASHGVQAVEAVTLTWTKGQLLLAYFCVFLAFFVISMEEQIQNNLSYYVYDKFKLSPLIATAQITAQIINGVLKLPLSKVLDVIGRAEGLLLMTIVSTTGLVMMAACKNAQTYAAAYCFYWVGFDGIYYVLQVFVADTSSLKNRAFLYAFTTAPYIATTWIGSPAAQSFEQTSGWRWGFGTFAIISPAVMVPIMLILWNNSRKALRDGLITKEKSGRTFWQNVNFYIWEIDVIGMLLIIAGFALILLPFSLAAYQTKGWASGMIIAMLTVGGSCLVAFPLWEKFFSKKCFIPWELLSNRTIIGACMLAAFINISFYMWDTYFYYYVQVVHGLNVIKTGYMTNIYSIGSCFWSFAVGIMIRQSGYFKWVAMTHLLLAMLGVGLMIYFRQPNHGIGWVVMCQIFISFGGGALVLTEEMAVMASVTHANIAVILAFISLFSSIGSSIGEAVANIIYEHTFLPTLAIALPGNMTLVNELYASTATQLTYPFGTPERSACLEAWGYSQKILCIAALVWYIPGIAFIAFWKNYNVKQMTQLKGNIL